MAGSKSQVLVKLWQGKKDSKALLSGVFANALPTVIPPGARVSMFKIDYQGERPENAPAYELVYFAEDERQDKGNGEGRGAGDDLPF